MRNEKKKLCNKPVFATALLVSITTGMAYAVKEKYQASNYLLLILKTFYLKINAFKCYRINVWLSKDTNQHRSVSLSRVL